MALTLPEGLLNDLVRRWDDVAKVAGARTRGLAHYLEIAERCAL